MEQVLRICKFNLPSNEDSIDGRWQADSRSRERLFFGRCSVCFSVAAASALNCSVRHGLAVVFIHVFRMLRGNLFY